MFRHWVATLRESREGNPAPKHVAFWLCHKLYFNKCICWLIHWMTLGQLVKNSPLSWKADFLWSHYESRNYAIWQQSGYLHCISRRLFKVALQFKFRYSKWFLLSVVSAKVWIKFVTARADASHPNHGVPHLAIFSSLG
jgi:hypothetical protein